ncbi:MAG: glycosyltransferase family 8 protein [Rhodospirillales bacterium]|nr:glycosyltransferase family 8 protein [Rhodospirillales bacterium]
MPLLLCSNPLYLQHAAVCLTSLLVNNPDLHFDIVLVVSSRDPMGEEKLRRSLAPFRQHSLKLLQFTLPQGTLLPLNPRTHYTLDNWTRLWVADFFAPEIERVLYLDCDLIVVGNVAPLWNTDLGGALFGAVDIPGSQRGIQKLDMRPEDGYFNSGVLLIDLAQWRCTRALNVVLDYVSGNSARLPDVDQDALNACFHARRMRLEYKWNAIAPFFREPLALPLPRAEIEAVCREARIIHFNGASKPWKYLTAHTRKREYWKYLHMTEWRDYVPPDRTLTNMLREAASIILPRPVKTILKRFL